MGGARAVGGVHLGGAGCAFRPRSRGRAVGDRRIASVVRRRLRAAFQRCQALFQIGDLAVAQFGGTLQVGGALGPLGLQAGLLQARLEVAGALDRLLLAFPLRLHRSRSLFQLRQLPLDRGAALGGCLVGLLLQRGELDFQLHHAAVHLVDLGWQRVDLDTQARRGLVDQVDRLVR